MTTTKTMTKTDIMTSLAMLRRQVALIDNPLARSNADAAVGELIAAIGATMPDAAVSHEQLQADYRAARQFIIDEREQRLNMQRRYPGRTDYWRGRVQNANAAGIALGRLAQALGLRVPSLIANAEPEPQQAMLISVPGREVMA